MPTSSELLGINDLTAPTTASDLLGIRRQPEPPATTALGLIKALGRGAAEGLTTELPGMAGAATEFIGAEAGMPSVEQGGRSLKEWSKKTGESLYGPQPERSTAENIVYEGSKMLAPSVIPGGVATTGMRGVLGVGKTVQAAKAATVAGDVAKAAFYGGKAKKAAELANTLGAAGSAVALYGTSQAQNTIDSAHRTAKELDAAGDTEGAAKARAAAEGYAPYITGAIEAAGEYFGTKYLGKLFGLSEAEMATKGAKEFGKRLLKTLGVEIGTEVGQAGSQAQVEKISGARPGADPLQEAFDVVGPTAFMTLLTGGLASMANRKEASKTDPTADKAKADLLATAIPSAEITVVNGRAEVVVDGVAFAGDPAELAREMLAGASSEDLAAKFGLPLTDKTLDASAAASAPAGATPNVQPAKEAQNVQTDQMVPATPAPPEVAQTDTTGAEGLEGGVPTAPAPEPTRMDLKRQAKDLAESKTKDEIAEKLQTIFGATYEELDQLEQDHPNLGTNKTVDLADEFMANLERAATDRDTREVERLLAAMREASREWDNISKNAGKVVPLGDVSREGVYDGLDYGGLIEKHVEVFGKAPVGLSAAQIRKALENVPAAEAPAEAPAAEAPAAEAPAKEVEIPEKAPKQVPSKPAKSGTGRTQLVSDIGQALADLEVNPVVEDEVSQALVDEVIAAEAYAVLSPKSKVRAERVTDARRAYNKNLIGRGDVVTIKFPSGGELTIARSKSALEEARKRVSRAGKSANFSKSQKTGNSTVASVVSELKEFLGRGYGKLTASGKLRVVQSVAELPESEGLDLHGKDGSIAGTYYAATGEVYLVADNIQAGDAQYVMLHEGGHALMFEDKVFRRMYERILDEFESRRNRDYRIQDAFRRVPADTAPENVRVEALMYFAQEKKNHTTGIWNRVKAAVRAWLARQGIHLKTLSNDDIVAMITQGVRGLARQEHGRGSLQVGGTAPALYSQSQTIEAAKAIFSKLDQVSRASFQGMKAQGVVNFLTKQGVKKSEMEAVGLMPWLRTRKPDQKVSREELLWFVKANTVELEDVVLGEPSRDTSGFSTSFDEDESAWILWDNNGEAVYDGFSGALRKFSSERAATAAIQEEAGLSEDVSGPTHFSQYTEPGAVEGSYREMFVTAPVIQSTEKFDPSKVGITRNSNGLVTVLYGGEPYRVYADEPKLQQDGSYRQTSDAEWVDKTKRLFEKVAQQTRFEWQDGHDEYYSVKNPIVRIRFNEVNADGKRLLRIEEMQGPKTENQKKMPGHLKDNIYQLGVKRILAYAKENGFDGVALATKPGMSAGETQADRYSLEKQVDELRYTPSDSTLDAYKNGKIEFSKTVAPDGLADVIGKDAAKKLMETEKKPGRFPARGGQHVLSGEELKFGGEGLKQLYDNQIPAMLEAYGKGKMVEVPFLSPQDKSGERWVVLDEEDMVVRRGWSEDILRKELEPGQRVSYQEDKAATMPFLPLDTAPASYPMFSVAEPKKILAAADQAFKDSRAKVDAALRALANPKSKIRQQYEKYAPKWLAVTSLHHISQVYGKDVTQLKDMDSHVDELVTTKTTLIDQAYAIHKAAEKAAKDTDGSGLEKFNRAALLGTFNQMTPWAGMYEQDWLPAARATDAPDAVKMNRMANRLRSAQRSWEAAGMQESTGMSFQEAYRESAKVYEALSPMEQIQLQRMVEDAAAIRARERTNLLKRIEELSEGDPSLRESLMNQFHATFSNLRGMYLPLSRFGDYILEYTDAKGRRVFETFPDDAQRKAARRALAAEGVSESTVVERIRDKNKAVIAGMPQELMLQLTRSVEAKFLAGVDPSDDAARGTAMERAQEAVADMNQTFFRWLPDTSAMKNSVRRKNIQGASDNMLRGYLDYVQRHAVAIAWAEVGRKIEQDIQNLANDNAERRASGLAGEGPVDITMRGHLLNDMRGRVSAIRTVTVGGMWSAISKVNTGYFMTSPSAFFVQMTQIPTLTLPKLGTMFGFTKATGALTRAGRDAFSKKFSAEAMLDDVEVNALYSDIRETVNEQNRKEGQSLGDPVFSPSQIRARIKKLSDYQVKLLTLREAMDRNLLDISATHEAFELTRGGDPDSKMNRLFRAVMLPMQHGELASRKTAVLATLELALKNGKGLFGRQTADGLYEAGAIDDIHEVVKGTLFSYAKEDMGAATQGGAVRTILQFQKFRVFTGLRIARLFLESVKTLPSAERTAARTEFVGIMGMSTLIGGVKGTVYASPLLAIANLLFGWDDDEPYDAELDFTNWLEKTFGKTAGDALAHGPLTLMGMNISRRVGLGDIYGSQAEPPPGLHGAALAAWWAGSLLGPTFSVGQGWFKGYDQMMNKGNYMRGLEEASPKPIKDAFKAFRYATEGVKTGDGRKLMGDEEIGPDDILFAALGVQPADVAQAQAANAALTKMKTSIAERRGRLIKDAADALLNENDADLDEAMDAIGKFAEKMPSYTITAGEIRGAVRKQVMGEFGVTGKRDILVSDDYDIDLLGAVEGE
jgi:hypothetical protein